MEKTLILIDLAYLNKISKRFGIKFNSFELSVQLAKQHGLWVQHTFIYTAPPFQGNPPSEDEATRKAKHDKWVARIEKNPDFTIRQGRCQKVDGEYHQKGVDTWLTMDLFNIPIKYKHIKTIIVIACDTDFVPIFNELRSSGIRIILYFYNDYIRHSEFSMSNAILSACDECVLFDKLLLERCAQSQQTTLKPFEKK